LEIRLTGITFPNVKPLSMEYRRWKDDTPLQTHVWADDDIPHQITQGSEIVFHHRCVRCGRDFVQPADGTGWQAAYVEVLRIELLADSDTERWVKRGMSGTVTD
jgi:hypothetical protein